MSETKTQKRTQLPVRNVGTNGSRYKLAMNKSVDVTGKCPQKACQSFSSGAAA